MRTLVDDAYGSDGVGGVILPPSGRILPRVDIEEWYRTQLDAQEKPVTVFVTGPATNIALFLQKYPAETAKIREIILMCGGMTPPDGDGRPVILPNGDIRAGNITPYAEFKAYQDPKSLNLVLNSGVRCVFMAMDASQNMVLTQARQAQILDIDAMYAPAFHRMLMAVEELDRRKFGLDGPSIHDPNVIIYALRPDLYKSRPLANPRFYRGAAGE